MASIELNQRRVIRLSIKKIVWAVVIIVVLLWLGKGFLFGNFLRPTSFEDRSGGAVPSSLPADYYYPDEYRQRPDITDTREFLKTSYAGYLKTRDVSEMVKEVKNAVRDVEGRVDSLNSSDRYGYVSFVVAKSRFEEFRSAVEGLTRKKLYREDISSQNLLSQKQGLELQTETATKRLADLEKNKTDLNARHNSALASLRAELSNVQNRLVLVQQEKAVAQSSDQVAAWQREETSLLQQKAAIQGRQTEENRVYNSQSQSLTTQIGQVNSQLQNLGQQDTQFANNIETVNGSVAVTWVSWWQLAKIFSPIHPTIVIIVLALLLLFYLNRRGYIPKVEFV